MPTLSEFAWCNGEIRPREQSAPSVASVSLHMGVAVFEGIMAYWNDDRFTIFRGEEHFARLKAGAARLGLDFKWTVDDLMRATYAILALDPPETRYIRPIVYRGNSELWMAQSATHPADVSIFTISRPRDVDALLTCQISPVERISSASVPARTKVTGTYINSFQARQVASQAGYDDCIMLDREGRIAEASAANIFFIRGDSLVTPPLNPDVFPGITRDIIQQLAADAGVVVHVEDMRVEDAYRVDGAFLCSTLMEIRGVSRLDEQPIRTLEQPIYLEMVRRFRRLSHA